MPFEPSSPEAKHELEVFKTDIDLVAYLQVKGYELDHSLTTSATTVLCQEKGSKISISRNKNNHWIFQDWKPPVTVSKSGGSIVDFALHYQKLSFGQMRRELRSYLNRGDFQVSYNQVQQQPAVTREKVSDTHFSFYKPRVTKFLNERGIPNQTLFGPLFKGRIGQKDLISTKGRTYSTTVFPMYEKVCGAIVGLEIKNALFSGSYQGSNKKTGFWRSNPQSDKPDLYLLEAPIDALAHYELKKNNNAFYVATNGQLGEDRLEVLKEYIEKREHRFTSFNLAMDHDAAGLKFNINLIGQVNIAEANADIQIKVDSDRHHARTQITATTKKDIEAFVKEVKQLNNTLELTSGFEAQYREIKVFSDDTGHHLHFKMNNKKSALKPIETLAIKVKNSPFRVERAQSKDFGQDLENKLGIIRSKEAIGVNDKGKTRFKSVWKNPALGSMYHKNNNSYEREH